MCNLFSEIHFRRESRNEKYAFGNGDHCRFASHFLSQAFRKNDSTMCHTKGCASSPGPVPLNQLHIYRIFSMPFCVFSSYIEHCTLSYYISLCHSYFYTCHLSSHTIRCAMLDFVFTRVTCFIS